MNNCAILVFAKNTSSECSVKRIVVDEKENYNLWKILNHKTVDIAKKSKIQYFIVNENVQIGNNFGEKISNAIQSIFDKGYEKIIVIGNDCPELTAQGLKSAQRKLNQNDFVFGPDFKGGAYLLGISKNQFNCEDFQCFKWQSGLLFSTITAFYKSKKIVVLPYLNDVHDAFSFKRAVHKLFFNSNLKRYLLVFFIFLKHTFNFVVVNSTLLKIAFLKYRGPPQNIVFAKI